MLKHSNNRILNAVTAGQTVDNADVTPNQDSVKRVHVRRARKAILQAEALDSLHKQEGDYYFLVRHAAFREAVTVLWGLGFQTNQIAEFIGNGINEVVVMRALRSYLSKFQTHLLTSFIQFNSADQTNVETDGGISSH